MKLGDHLSRLARDQPDGTAIIRDAASTSFAALDRSVWNLAAWLRKKGVMPGDVVGLSFRDQVRHFAVSLALIRLGAVQIAWPPDAPARRRNELAARAGVALCLTGAESDPGADYPLLAVEFEAHARNRGPIDPAARFESTPDSPLALNMGSGTTGVPKLMLIKVRQQIGRRETERDWVRVRPGEKSLIQTTVDYYTAKGRRLDCLFQGGTNVFYSGPPDGFSAYCNRHKIEHLHLLVSQAELILAATPERERLPHVRVLRVSSSTVGERLREAVRERLTENMVVGYGANEVGNVANASAAEQRRYPGAVGRPGHGVRIEVVDDEDRPLPAGEVGHIRIRSPGMIDGYVDDPAATARAFRAGWFYPGDLGSLTPDGVLVFHDRADDMMILGGINIFPREIELALEQHPAVLEAQAFPLPHPVHQDIPAAAVVLRGEATEPELIAFCRERLGVQAPKMVVIVEKLPDQTRGKLLKRALPGLLGITNPFAGGAP